VTTKSEGQPDGSRIITKTDKDGKVISKTAVGEKSLPSASSTNTKTGEKISSQGNPDGSRTVTKTDKNGKTVSKKTIKK